ncbi:MAG TPA: hypothetical protein VFD22_13235 [Gemmatimonadaceae bacterium]|jgi:hypothetical protein|nr:hypothetical protein [Gemmatimonadaceae bacterium]
MTDTPPPTKPSWKRRHWRKITGALIVLVPVLIFALWAGITLAYAYSKGDRAGYTQKISKRGWLCKTWEGELAQANLPGSMPQIFKFSVRNDSIARLIQESLGKRVSLTYEEHRGVPTRCFGETEYYITNIRKLEP